MRRYLLMLARHPDDGESANAEEQQIVAAAHEAFSAYVSRHGAQLGTAPLAGADTATTVRHVDGEIIVTDGPFAATAEAIAGCYDVELPDLDHAIAAASLLPAGCSVEIRPTIVVP